MKAKGWLGLGLLALSACATASHQPAKRVTAPSAGEVRITGRVAKAPTAASYRTKRQAKKQGLDLANAIVAVTEHRVTGPTLSLSKSKPLEQVDFRSTLVLDFDPTEMKRIASALGKGKVSLPDPSAKDQQTKLNAKRFLNYTKQMLETGVRLDKAVGRLRAGEAIDRATLLSDISANSAAEHRIAEMAAGLVVEMVRLEGEAEGLDVTWSEEDGEFAVESLNERLHALEDELAPTVSGVIRLSPTAVAKMFETQYELLKEIAEEDLKALEDALGDNEILLRVRASVLRDGKEIHVPVLNYDRKALAAGPIKKAVSFDLSPEQQQRIEEKFETVNEYAEVANDLRDSKSELRQALRDLDRGFARDLQDLKLYLNGLRNRLQAGWSSASVDGALASIRALVESPPENFPDETKAALEKTLEAGDELKLAIDALETEIQKVSAFLDSLDETGESTPTAAVLGVISGARETMTSAAAAIEVLPAKVRGVASGLEDLSGSMAAVAEFASDEAKVEALRVAGTLETPERIKLLGAELASSYPILWARVDDGISILLSTDKRLKLASDGGTFDEIHPDVRARSLGNIVPAKIFVNNTVAGNDENDVLAISVELVGKDEDGNEEVRITHSQQLSVVKRGLYNTWETPLIFVDRVNEPGGAVSPTNFEAAPSVAWTLHYRKLEGVAEADDGASTWNVIDPGLGVHVAALNFEDDSVEIGAGIHLSLFSDLLTFGYGWNISVDRDREYFMIGIGLIEGFNAVSGALSVGK